MCNCWTKIPEGRTIGDSLSLHVAQIYFFFLFGVWARALPAAILLALLERLLRSVFDAAAAALLLVTFLSLPIFMRFRMKYKSVTCHLSFERGRHLQTLFIWVQRKE